MPRKPATPKPTTGRQSTLSFNTRVTKAVPKNAKEAALSTTPIVKKEEESQTEISHIPLKPEEGEEIKAEPKKVEDEEEEKKEIKVEEEPVPEKPEAELRAEKVTDSQIGNYWSWVESERLSKRVHQEDLDISEKVLRYFDVCSHYGPCIGLTRLRRWQRAEKLGLKPPIEVLAVLLKDQESPEEKKHEKAHIDEILNPTAIVASE
ncbi:uncharacterized protein MKZ38_010060 [Zalerion maritima]|uniref:DNA polymerase delta subunit 4 n=1 Tax=Zalerion maritima TaxID=339359 RepID=A0AAD5RGI4_9PEZI|nr:uncharacterized protein MKZ38_010060 [Zalerion maritima]